MATDQQLPQNDPDLMLALQLGTNLDQGTPFGALNNPLIDQLLTVKDNELADYVMPASVSDNIWNQINKQTEPKQANVTPLFSRSSAFAWASAAVLVIAAFIGIYLISMLPQFELVAQSDSSILEITLDDGSEVTLRPFTKLYADKSSTDRTYRLEGEAFFDVVSDADAPFSVDATYGTVTVLGTRFNVSDWGGKAVVYLEEGRVSFTSNQTGEQIVLEPGQASEISTDTIQLLTEADADQYTDWQSNRVFFDNSDPQQVINEINQHFGITITINQLEDRSEISGTLMLESIQQTLDDLGLVLGGTFRTVNANEYEFISME